MLKVVDLCAGTGAFTQVFKNKENFEVVFANDYVSESEEIYKLNHGGDHFALSDIHTLGVEDIPDHDILCAGFPCQAFSIAGKARGFDDHRSNVFWKILEILEFHLPDYIILENVKNLQTHDNGNTFKIIKYNLEQLGYQLKYKVLNTCKITSIPQNRERIYIVGFLNSDDYNKFNFNIGNRKNKKIEEFLQNSEDIDDKYYYDKRYKAFDCIKKAVVSNISNGTVYQYRRYYVRENKSGVCPTLTANMGSGGHNVPIILDDRGIRKLTPRECFNLQGFPVNYKLPKLSDGKLYKLAGNAITVPVLEHIVSNLAEII